MKLIKNPLILGLLFILIYTLYLDKCALETCDERIKDLETWQGNVTKILWTIATTVTGLVAATIYKLIME